MFSNTISFFKKNVFTDQYWVIRGLKHERNRPQGIFKKNYILETHARVADFGLMGELPAE
jgi:hypothetical protein